jgi:type IV pilus assembly protein PilF
MKLNASERAFGRSRQTYSRIAVTALLLVAIAGCQNFAPPTRNSATQGQASAGELNAKIGLNYLQKGNLDLARDKIEKGIRLDPNSSLTHFAMALFLERTGDSKRAEAHHKRAVQLDPQSGEAANAFAAYLCQNQRYPEADELFQRAVSNPYYDGATEALVNAGVCARKIPDAAKAETYLRQALQRRSTDQLALYHMAELKYDANEALQARAFLQRLDSIPNFQMPPEGLMLGYRIERKLANREQAESFRLRLKRDFPNSLLEESNQ